MVGAIDAAADCTITVEYVVLRMAETISIACRDPRDIRIDLRDKVCR